MKQLRPIANGQESLTQEHGSEMLRKHAVFVFVGEIDAEGQLPSVRARGLHLAGTYETGN